MIHWMTTLPNPNVPPSGYENFGQRGWRLHAVEAPANALASEVREQAASCGLVPAHGWGLDLFIEDRCKRCVRAQRVAPTAGHDREET